MGDGINYRLAMVVDCGIRSFEDRIALMELTKSEREIADRYIAKREKQLAEWPYRRWAIIVIFSIFAFTGQRIVSRGMSTVRDDREIDYYVDRAVRETPPPGQEQLWAVGMMLKTSKVIELRQQIMAYALMEVAIGYVGVLCGVVMITVTILRWKRDERDMLICKLSRRQLQELEPGGTSNAGPPAQPQASAGRPANTLSDADQGAKAF